MDVNVAAHMCALMKEGTDSTAATPQSSATGTTSTALVEAGDEGSDSEDTCGSDNERECETEAAEAAEEESEEGSSSESEEEEKGGIEVDDAPNTSFMSDAKDSVQ